MLGRSIGIIRFKGRSDLVLGGLLVASVHFLQELPIEGYQPKFNRLYHSLEL